MNIAPVHKAFGSLLAFVAVIFVVAQIWFPDMFTMDDFIKFAGTIAVIYAFAAIFSMITSSTDKKDKETGDKTTATENTKSTEESS